MEGRGVEVDGPARGPDPSLLPSRRLAPVLPPLMLSPVPQLFCLRELPSLNQPEKMVTDFESAWSLVEC